MSLCKVCYSIDVGPGGVGSIHPETILGPYSQLLTRAGNGCEGCQFFCNILQTSNAWKGKLEELKVQVVVFSSLRLDVRKPEKMHGRSWSCDDLLFDVCVAEGYEGM